MADEEYINPVRKALGQLKWVFWAVALFSCCINILMLTGSLFMLQVYDRVLASGSIPTLVIMFALVVILYTFLGLFEFTRSKALSQAGYRFETRVAALAKKVWVTSGLSANQMKANPIADLVGIRQFLSSNGLPALFDLPWVPIYLLLVYALHTWLGVLATLGAVIVVLATFLSECLTKKKLAESTNWDSMSNRLAEGANRNAEVIVSMGMMSKITESWQTFRKEALLASQSAGSRSTAITAFTKAIRMLVQSGMLALGAYLAILQEISPGTMIAASILGGRAVAPIDAAVGNWKNFIRSRQSYSRLKGALEGADFEGQTIDLPTPKGVLTVENLVKMSAQKEKKHSILNGLNFALQPGDGVGVIGPSASGKSTLARLLVGLTFPDGGSVRLDGATYDQWDPEKLGQHIGYLPQDIELMAGTIHQNIARFDPDVSSEDIIAAAKLAGVHELILKLPNGYATDLRRDKYLLSGGQTQRIALARAVLRTPPLVVLDEPNSNLDTDGDNALSQAIVKLREGGSCVVVMTHRPSSIMAINKVLLINEGRQVAFGDKDEVAAKVKQHEPKKS